MSFRSGVVQVAAVGVLLLGTGCGTRLHKTSFATTTSANAGGSAQSTTSTKANNNTASDVGVTPNEIRVGVVASITSPLGPDAFSQSSYSVRAYFDGLNDRGGINARKVKVITCDDGGAGTDDSTCVQKLIEQDKVFALVGTSTFNYAGAPFVNQHGVPDIGGQPVGNEYDQYPHLFGIYGSSSPRNGTIGFNGKLYGGTEVYRYFKEKLGAKVAAVVSYNISDSQRFANYTAAGLRAEGFKVVTAQVDFSAPNWDAVALNFRSKKVDLVFDAIENNGNVKLCEAIDRNHAPIKAKVLTVQSWSDSVRTDYKAAPICRNALYATANDLSYADTQYPPVAAFRADMKRSFPEREDKLSMWSVEGWAAAQWFDDAVRSCGEKVTRTCVEAFMNRAEPYDGHGLLTPRSFVVSINPGGTSHNCLNVARWQDSAEGGRGGWVTQTPDMNANCFDVPSLAYSP